MSGSGAADNEVLYLLVVLYSFYFLSARQAALQLALVGVAYALVLLDEVPLDVGVTRWVTTIGTLSVAGALVGWLNRRVARLIADSTAAPTATPSPARSTGVASTSGPGSSWCAPGAPATRSR